MIKKIYCWLHRITSKLKERGEYSAGYWQNLVRKMASELFNIDWKRVLEVGCGEGLFLTEVASTNKNTHFYGVDNWEYILEKAQDRIDEKDIGNVELFRADAVALPFKDSYFDGIFCTNLVYNLASIDVVKKTLNEMARVCKSGGKIIFDFRNTANPILYFKYKLAPIYDETVKKLPLKTYREEEIQLLLDEAGLKISRKFYMGSPIKNIAPIIILEAIKQ